MTTAERLAELVVGPAGANVQQGQLVEISADLGKEELTRAVARAAYRRGAKFVEAIYWDPHVKRARLELAAEDTLDFVPAWLGKRVLELGEERAASILLTGPTAPGLFDELDPERVALDRLPSLKEYLTVVDEQTISWAIIPGPNDPWARFVHPDLAPDEALAQLWQDVAYVCRLDTEDPARAWHERMRTLAAVAAKLDELRFDALEFDTLLDENAASHIAIGNAYHRTVGPEDVARANKSEIHTDFMIGGDDVAVTGVTQSGERVPVLRGGRWQI